MSVSHLFLPGWATTETLFDQVPESASHYRAESITKSQIESAKSLLRNNPTPVTCIGFSMGAMIIAEWMQDPTLRDKIKTAILIAPATRYPGTLITPMLDQLDQDKETCLSQFYEAGAGDAANTSLNANTHKWRDTLSTADLKDSLAQLGQIDLTQYDYSQNTISTKWIHGTRDAIAPYATTKKWMRHWQHCEPVAIKGAGHFLPLEEDMNAFL